MAESTSPNIINPQIILNPKYPSTMTTATTARAILCALVFLIRSGVDVGAGILAKRYMELVGRARSLS
jgi:hypothetical protein